VDASRCISYLTVERRPAIDPGMHIAIGEWLFGCDVCQEVCPHNRERPDGAAGVNPAYATRNASFDLLDVLGWTMEDRSVALSKTALKRATAPMWKRNALIVAGNAVRGRRDELLLARIREIAADVNENEMVRATARDVLASLG
jgi:epoxyqueuosine reductase